jgi:hypothetical protein
MVTVDRQSTGSSEGWVPFGFEKNVTRSVIGQGIALRDKSVLRFVSDPEGTLGPAFVELSVLRGG